MSMGFLPLSAESESGSSPAPLFQAYRDEFPVADQLIYLNHAAVAPLCRRSADAMKWLADDSLQFGSLHYDKWLAAYAGLRAAAAQLINAKPDEIAIVKNTSEGISIVATGLSWRRGDRIVAFKEEFPANYFPWLRLAEKGVEITWLSIYDPLDRIDEAAKEARLLAISYINYLSGFRINLDAIGEICRRRNCFFFVDAIQGMGAFPIDVDRSHIDALAADGHKWMLGPEGNGVLYVRSERLDEIEPVEFGWTNVAGYADYASRDMALRKDAGRYECGTLNTVGCFGQRAALEFLLEIGVENIAAAVTAVADQIYDGVRAKGYEVMAERTPESGAGIVTFRHPSIAGPQIVSKLRESRIVAAPRQGWIRASPHFYVSPSEISHVLEILPPV
ncbi:MAG TPA: aminotransferase class V-fold PLP-dependent enzyme [Bryobacteraceae bacterium]|nr:aminotransferase class V-fold PLP-dependent enzyme [Bryobacteraceae bacterium]